MGAKGTAEFDVVAQEGQSSEKEAGGQLWEPLTLEILRPFQAICAVSEGVSRGKFDSDSETLDVFYHCNRVTCIRVVVS